MNRPEINPVFFQGIDALSCRMRQMNWVFILQVAVSTRSQANADIWDKQKSDVRNITFDPIDGGRARLRPMLEFARI